MKTIVALMLLAAVMVFPGTGFADECLEGDCSNGRGKGFTDEGKIYDGEWLRGEPHGEGRLFIGKGKIITGRWLHGQLVEENKEK